ncbi:MAG: bifunctional hydroxymethylpyrimidine kinase/phosphomethylpyrimidine kinase [Chloroflexi bacterium]|nr:bifunctional hydroxymethylpyrimidine kinase/phosphomethylpyrimidine kinase [Chloroflexota bacterium]
MESTDLIAQLSALTGVRVLVVGDLFLDEYVVGQATRLSREAPIPVLEFLRRFYVPGGAANPAHNICALGGLAEVVGVIGQDEAGERLLDELRKRSIGVGGIVTDPNRPTTTKMRIVAEGSLRFPQQLARVDYLDRRPVAGSVQTALLTQLERLTPTVDAVLFSDYRTGVASAEMVEAGLRLARQHGKLITVDSQGDWRKYRGFDLVRGNRGEAEAVVGHTLESEEDYRLAGEMLQRELGAQVVVITRGPEGMSLISAKEGYLHLPAANRTEVFDVTGAGDTVIAVLTQALAGGLDVVSAARLANYAAGLVIRKLGNAVPSIDELSWAIQHW